MLFVFTCLAGLVLGLAPPAFSTHGASALKNTAVSENFYGVDIIDHQAWIVGYYGTILHSSDRGKSWEVQSSPTQSSLFNVRFVSPLKGWIGGSYGTVLHTDRTAAKTGARSLSARPNIFSLPIGSKKLTVGWSVAGARLFEHEDGGRSWSASPYREILLSAGSNLSAPREAGWSASSA